jgi:hypothetical protein
VTTRTEEFLAVYRAARVEDQRGYYECRAGEFGTAHRQLLLLSAILFGVSAFVGFLAGLDFSGNFGFALAAAIIPPLTTALAAYEGLYAFERNAKRYRDAARNLNLVRPPSRTAATDESVAAYVARIEAIFAHERGQWGQLAAEIPASVQKQT